MLDINDIVDRLIEHPSKDLYYSISEGKFLDRKVTKDEYDSNDDLCCFRYAKKNWEAARKGFIAKHPEIFTKIPNPCHLKEWNALIKENNLEKEWFLEFRLALSEDVTMFTHAFGIEEIEAEPELYIKIKKQLKIFEAKHYEKKYSDMVLFFIGADYECVPMTILGNAGSVFGVGFYPGDEYADSYLLIRNQEDLRIDYGTANSICTMLSFYFEKKHLTNMPFKDPYESNFHFTSSYLDSGTLMNSRLPKSIAIRGLNFLENANYEMENFVSSPESKLKDNQFYDVFLELDKFKVQKSNPLNSFEGHLPFDINDVRFLDPEIKFKRNGAGDITVKCLPECRIGSDKDDQRILNFTYVLILCDHQTGMILSHAIGVAKDFCPFDSLVKSFSKEIQKITVPKTLYVNNYFDFQFFNAFFAPYIEKNKAKVEVLFEELMSDAAFDSLQDCLMGGNDEEDDDSLLAKKKIAKA